MKHDTALAVLTSSDLANARGGEDGGAMNMASGLMNAPWAMSHYAGVYNDLRDCADKGICKAPSRMKAGAELGAYNVPVPEIVQNIKLPFPMHDD
jgi:hypothetical protein